MTARFTYGNRRMARAAILMATCLATACITVGKVSAQAVVDEGVFVAGGAGQILYVDQANAAANDNNGGTAANPFKTINAAANAASTKTQNGTPVKIVVKPGTYREGFRVGGGTALTVIEGSEPGKVIVSGSKADDWALSTWTKVKLANGNVVYKKAWPYKYGLLEPQGIEQVKKYPHLAIFRREGVFVNGKGLTPHQLEDFRYDYNANPRYVYQGYRDPSTMPPGTFAVNDQRTDHADAGMVFLRLPAGVAENKARVEIADDSVLIDSKRLLIEVKKSNVVLRNLVVQNSASNYMSAGVGVNINSFNYTKINNVMLDRCEFNWNNGSGAVIWAADDVTIKNTKALYNGCSGLFVWGCNKVLLQDSETSYNAWVADLSKNGWDPGGVKALISNSTILRHKSNYNKYIGMWLDEGRPGNANNTFENCDFSYNQASYEGAGAHGLLFEFASGPNTVKNCRMIENGGKGIETSYGAAETYIDNCIVLNNTKAQISCTSQQGAAGLSDDLIRTRITNSTVATNKSYHLVEFYELDFMKGTTANKGQRWQASANKYWSNVPEAFVTNWWDKPVNSATYKQKTSQDTDALWQQPNFKALYAYDPTVQKSKTSP